MIHRNFGNTGLVVPAIGFGAGHIGEESVDDRHIEKLLNLALDSGVNFIDTARSYGLSEERIGRLLSGRRKEFILSTKGGYTFPGFPDWSYEATLGTVDESLKRLRTDYIDIFHLHSCDKWVLEKGEVILALEKAKEQGKIRIIAYSGENDALDYAIWTGRFGSIQCSANLFDQNGIDTLIASAHKNGMGTIAKRPLGNAVWRYASRPDGHGHAAYYDRMKEMNINPGNNGWEELAIRFSLFSTGTDCMILGTSSPEHLHTSINILEKGPLEEDILNGIRSAFMDHGQNWPGLI